MLLVSGCENPFVDSWSGEDINDAFVIFEGKTYSLAQLQKTNIPSGDYHVIVGSPRHHSFETIIPIGSRSIPKIEMVPYSMLYSPFIVNAVLSSTLDMHGEPISPQWDYSTDDIQVIAWIMWNIPNDLLHTQIIRWYRPDGLLYREETLPDFKSVSDSPVVTCSGLPLQLQPGWAVNAPIDLPGIWTVEIVIDNLLAARMSFSI